MSRRPSPGRSRGPTRPAQWRRPTRSGTFRVTRRSVLGALFASLSEKERSTLLDLVGVTELPESVAGGEDCLTIGSEWLHLWICLASGHTGCCLASLNSH